MADMDVKGFEAGKRKGRYSDLVLRTAALSFTLAAAVLLGVNKQTKFVMAQPFPTLPPMSVPQLTAKWHYLSAYIFFVVANSIASGYAAAIISLITSLAAKKRRRPLKAVIVLHLLMVGLLFSSLGATGAVGLLGQKGNTHVGWKKVCNVFDKFCHQVSAAFALSFVGSVAFFLLVILAALNLHKKSN